MDDVSKLSKLLFEVDPLDTCCKENGCFDEYDHIANWTLDAVAEGKEFKLALYQTVSDFFYVEAAQQLDYNLIESKWKLL